MKTCLSKSSASLKMKLHSGMPLLISSLLLLALCLELLLIKLEGELYSSVHLVSWFCLHAWSLWQFQTLQIQGTISSSCLCHYLALDTQYMQLLFGGLFHMYVTLNRSEPLMALWLQYRILDWLYLHLLQVLCWRRKEMEDTFGILPTLRSLLSLESS